MTAFQVVVKIVIEKILSIQSALLAEVPTLLQKQISKYSERRRKKLVRMKIQKTDRHNQHSANVSYADLKITSFLNVQSHLKRMRNGRSKSESVKEVIVYCKNNTTMVIIKTTKRYMHLWYVCLIMKKFLKDILVTVRS